jgi:predicted ferric reductase
VKNRKLELWLLLAILLAVATVSLALLHSLQLKTPQYFSSTIVPILMAVILVMIIWWLCSIIIVLIQAYKQNWRLVLIVLLSMMGTLLSLVTAVAIDSPMLIHII